jgi:RNA polymerase subunit RPABC4/transcription elongation factor Spt4
VIIVILVLLTILALGAVAYPLWAGGEEQKWEESPPDQALEDLLVQKEAAYAAIKDLDFDYQMGKLSAGDYAEMKDRYKGKAISVLKQLDELTPEATASAVDSGMEPAEQIEAEVRALRQEKGVALAEPPSRPCRVCGLACQPDDNFCPACGSLLALACPHCGEGYQEGDRFCPHCGRRLAGQQIAFGIAD